MKDPITKQEVDIRKLSYEQAYSYLQQAEKKTLAASDYEVEQLRQRLVTELEMGLWEYQPGKDAIKVAVEALGRTPLKIEWGKNTRADYEAGKIFIDAPEKKADGMAILVFELTNMALTPRYRALDKLAAQGLVARNVFIWENERLEVENSLLCEILFVQAMLDSKRVSRKDFGPRLDYLIMMGGNHVGDIIDLGTKKGDKMMEQHLGYYGSIWDKYYKEAFEVYTKENGKKGLYEGKNGSVVLPELKFPEDEVSLDVLYSNDDLSTFLSKFPGGQKNTTQKSGKDDDNIFN